MAVTKNGRKPRSLYPAALRRTFAWACTGIAVRDIGLVGLIGFKVDDTNPPWTLNYGNYGILLVMSTAAFVSSAVGMFRV